MDDLHKNHPTKRRVESLVLMSDSDKGSRVEQDRRLPMFGYTVETLSLLVLPMVKDR